jgi:hypothetical protein
MDFWDQMVDCVCRPPRDVYPLDALPGGRAGREFAVGPVTAVRQDYVVVRRICCSWCCG